MSVAAVDGLGFLPSPPSKGNNGACQLLEGQVLAYASHSVINIVDVRSVQFASALMGLHSCNVTALSWCPEQLKDMKHGSPVRLASGDAEGRVVCWDVHTGQAISGLDDAWQAATGSRNSTRSGGVRALAWVMSGPCLLAVALSNMLIIWDPRGAGGGVVWKKELPADSLVSSIQVDPTDRRRLCLCGEKGSITVIRLLNLGRDRVEQQTYKVDGTAAKANPIVRCAFSTSTDLLYILLPRELVVFDLEFGQPAATTGLGSSRPPFRDILGCFGHSAAGLTPSQAGIDNLFCSHQDGSISAWQRKPDVLTYSLVALHPLLPPPSRINNNHTLALLGQCAATWRRCVAGSGRDTLAPEALHTTTSFLQGFDAATDSQRSTAEDAEVERSSAAVDPPVPQPEDAGPRDEQSPSDGRVVPPSLLVVNVTDDGQVWQWDVPLQHEPRASISSPPPGPSSLAVSGRPATQTPQGTPYTPLSVAPTRDASAGDPRPPSTGPPADQNGSQAPRRPELLALLHSLPHSVTTISACAAPVSLSEDAAGGSGVAEGRCTGLVAAATVGGHVEVVNLAQGSLLPLQPHLSISLGVHKEVVRGVRWLGSSSLLASFSSEKAGAGYCNRLLLTDVRTRISLPFREVASEASAMLGIRASVSGRYLLVLLRAAPSEIWMVDRQGHASRVRVLDLPFTAVEWVQPNNSSTPADPMPAPKRTYWSMSPPHQERSMSGISWEGTEADLESPVANPESEPEEKLAFALADGRVGVLSVKGRKVTDTKPKRPVWGVGGAADAATTAISAWGHLVMLGNEDGLLSRWDTVTGRTTSLQTQQGTVRRIHFAAPPNSALRQPDSQTPPPDGVNARLAVLFGNGAFGVWELDSSNELRASPLTPSSGARYGKITDLSWAPLPHPVGPGSVLALVTESGSLAFVDATQTTDQPSHRQRIAAFRGLLAGVMPGQLHVSLPPCRPLGSSLLMPRPWSALLSMLIQVGVPPKLLRAFCRPLASSPGMGLDAVEAELWALLPGRLREAWDSSGQRISSGEVQDLARLASDRSLRALVKRRSGSLTATSSQPDLEVASPGEERVDAGLSASTSQPDSEDTDQLSTSNSSRLGDLSLADKPDKPYSTLLHVNPKATPMGSLKARMSKLKAGAREAMQRSVAGAESSHRPGGPAEQYRVSADAEPHQPAPLGMLMGTLAAMRAAGNLLYPCEWAAYEQASRSQSPTERMAVAADVAGSREEAHFWRALPPTLATLRSSLPQSFTQPPANLVLYTDPQTGISAYRRASEDRSRDSTSSDPRTDAATSASQVPPLQSPAGGEVSAVAVQGELWSEAMQVKEAQERASWHEKMSRSNIEQSEALQERRVLEYITLGDNQTAVGFLLASAPDRSTRFYRDALCTIALAAASTEAFQATTPGVPEPVSRTLHIQVAKVVTAHAASVGDSLLGVPLLCSAGLPMEAVNVLQDNGLWKYAATLAAHAVRRDEQTAALERWASHIHNEEGNLWRALGVLTAAGALKSAVLLLRKCKMPDCTAAYVDAATTAGFGSQSGNSETGGLEDWQQAGRSNTRRRTFSMTQESVPDNTDRGSVTAEFEQYCIDVLQRL